MIIEWIVRSGKVESCDVCSWKTTSACGKCQKTKKSLIKICSKWLGWKKNDSEIHNIYVPINCPLFVETKEKVSFD